ncbi:MAG: methionyl-tRNA formyltransferase [Hydrogenophaga sp.]|uniref:methionyl-tRNA formyltransferase n=1 Tax=Hydrogenophaga sp. TaxID=1904254 RepID=UPI00169450D2|nr:methionyl-tRNA formyltransferase [Hydrogenophaga sp.]NIM39735.1 methionyl-tRNA formyltransferase [Hydrogenophaga sp.]NIN24939.1 methionyl-tRNA formyltransferase [Hydrogenophaga sp.]NIN29451.1 methionyl-tRNA formyltransferase [Hydrogenophaga sp.]NIN53974.1 methionyl-tRNA formyltransferase [Hydrogenophaga sp.]NIO50178.1 methionyl-tRNA formyltransferase [Hydrogenophaga sp.]
MKLIFAGTPAFARVALERLLAAGFDVPLVLTQPDRPAGRGMKLQASPVKALALERGIAVSQPRGLRLDGRYADDAAAARQAIDAVRADAMVVAAYGLILPRWVLDAPRLGCLNIHASLLPRWRGAAPIHRAIEAGDTETGVTIMQMDEGLDTGDMLLRERIAIRENDTTGSLHDRLAVLGGRLIVEALEIAACGGLRAEPQPQEGVTYAHKIEKAEAVIDWTQPATAIARRVRAFDPFPGAHTTHAGEAIKVWAAEPLAEPRAGKGRAGEVLAIGPEGITVACGEGALRLTALQRAGGKRLPAADFLRGFALATGEVLGGGA